MIIIDFMENVNKNYKWIMNYFSKPDDYNQEQWENMCLRIALKVAGENIRTLSDGVSGKLYKESKLYL